MGNYLYFRGQPANITICIGRREHRVWKSTTNVRALVATLLDGRRPAMRLEVFSSSQMTQRDGNCSHKERRLTPWYLNSDSEPRSLYSAGWLDTIAYSSPARVCYRPQAKAVRGFGRKNDPWSSSGGRCSAEGKNDVVKLVRVDQRSPPPTPLVSQPWLSLQKRTTKASARTTTTRQQ